MFVGKPNPTSTMEKTLKQNLEKLRILMEASGVSERTLGRAAIKNPLLFERIRQGKGFTVRIYDDVVQWVSDNWPAGLDWPKDIERPAPKETKDGE